MRLYSTWQSKEFSDATLKVWNLEFKEFNDFVSKYGHWNSETDVYSAFRMVCNFFNGIGTLLREELVDIKMIDSFFTIAITATWKQVQPLMEGARRQQGYRLFKDFEDLYSEIEKYEKKLQQSKARQMASP